MVGEAPARAGCTGVLTRRGGTRADHPQITQDGERDGVWTRRGRGRGRRGRGGGPRRDHSQTAQITQTGNAMESGPGEDPQIAQITPMGRPVGPSVPSEPARRRHRACPAGRGAGAAKLMVMFVVLSVVGAAGFPARGHTVV